MSTSLDKDQAWVCCHLHHPRIKPECCHPHQSRIKPECVVILITQGSSLSVVIIITQESSLSVVILIIQGSSPSVVILIAEGPSLSVVILIAQGSSLSGVILISQGSSLSVVILISQGSELSALITWSKESRSSTYDSEEELSLNWLPHVVLQVKSSFHLLRLPFCGQWWTLFQTWLPLNSYLVPTQFLGSMVCLKLRPQIAIGAATRYLHMSHKLYGGRSPKFIWAQCHVMCTAVLIGWDPATPYSPAFGLVYESTIGQQR